MLGRAVGWVFGQPLSRGSDVSKLLQTKEPPRICRDVNRVDGELGKAMNGLRRLGGSGSFKVDDFFLAIPGRDLRQMRGTPVGF